jgi:KaiC/GvpD/RAD55 family RecA-like ATPase
MSFRPYVDHGWKLCPIRDGEKRPRGENWNSPARAMSAAQADHATAAGLMHAYSGTCALDLDNVELTRVYLAERGIDLNELLQAPDAVHISSGTLNRGKLLYALPSPLPSKKIVSDQKVTLFELRCGTADGAKSVQDLLPPSPHPSGRSYEWRYNDELTGTWQSLPSLPPALHALWIELLGPRNTGTAPAPREEITDVDPELLQQAHTLLAGLDPDCDYDSWLRMGMALDNDLGDLGWQLWNEWSAKGKKYPGDQQLQTHWNSFGRYNGPPVTLGTFRREQRATASDFDDVSAAAEEWEDPFDAEIKSKASKLKLWTLDEIQSLPWPEWIIRGVLPKAELSMVYGPSGIGKSFVVLDMALAVARGCNWNDSDTRQGGVLWIAAEAFLSMKPRTKAYAQANEIDLADLADSFRVLEGFSLSDEAQVSALCEAAKALPQQQLIVVDTLAAASAGIDENNSEMNAILGACRKLHYATRASVLLIHHSGKDAEKGARGWSGIRAAMQAELRIDFDEAAGTRVMTSTKQRDGADGKGWAFTLIEVPVGIDDRDETITSAYVKHHGEVDLAPRVQGDGGGRPGPKAPAARAALELAREVIGAAPDASSLDVVAAIIDSMAPPPEGGRDERRKKAVALVDKLVAEQYLAQSGGRVKLVDPPEPQQAAQDDGSDLV